MKCTKNILIISMLFLFIGCTAWPALIPVPPGKKKTSITPIPLPSSTAPATSVSVTIKDGATGNALPIASPIKVIAYSTTLNLKAFNGTAELTGITWTVTAQDGSTATTLATIAQTGALTSATTTGIVKVKAVHSSGSSATVDISITVSGASILAFDGKNFLEL